MNRFISKGVVLLLFLFTISSTPLFSQDCDGVYKEAVELLSRRNLTSSKEALRMFESAKRCYMANRNAEGVKNCNSQIATCNQVISYINSKSQKKIINTELQFTAEGSMKDLPVNSNVEFTQDDASKEWCELTKEGDNLKIYVTPNKLTEPRTQLITMEWSGYEQHLSITQDAAAASLSLSSNDVSFQSNDVEETIQITSNSDFRIDSSEVPWCEVRQDGMYLYIKPNANESETLRDGIIYIIANNIREQIKVTQGIENFKIITPDGSLNLAIVSKGCRVEIPIEFTVSQGGESDWSVYSFPNWCDVHSNDPTFISLRCTPNKMDLDREGVIIIKRGGRSISLNIKQYGLASKYTSSASIKRANDGTKLYNYAIVYKPSSLEVSTSSNDNPSSFIPSAKSRNIFKK